MEEEEEVPLKIIELNDFLRLPSILSKRLAFKNTKTDKLSIHEQSSDGLKFKVKRPGIALVKQQTINPDNNNGKELIVPKDVIVFADEADRTKIGLFNKSTNLFSRHLLITSSAALQALIPSLTNAKEWIIVCKLKYVKHYIKEPSIQGDILISLNVSHPLVRYEIITALELLQQSFNETKSAYIVIDFSQILSRWFKNYLRRTEQYPSLPNRLFYRYQIHTSKCSVTLGKRQYYQDHNSNRFRNSFQKLLYKTDYPIQIYINMNSLPTIVYSIQFNNIFIYSMNDEYKKILKDMGNGLSLCSIKNLYPLEDQENKLNNSSALVQKNKIIQEKYPIQQKQIELTQEKYPIQQKQTEITQEKYPIQQQQIEVVQESYPIQPEEEIFHEHEEIKSSPLFQEPTEQERILIGKIWYNRMQIQMQHEQLMMKAARVLCFSSIHKDPLNRKNNQSGFETM